MSDSFWMADDKRKKHATNLNKMIGGVGSDGKPLPLAYKTAQIMQIAKMQPDERKSILREAQRSEADLTLALNDLSHQADGKPKPQRKTSDLFYGPEGLSLDKAVAMGQAAIPKFHAAAAHNKPPQTGAHEMAQQSQRAYPTQTNSKPTTGYDVAQQVARNRQQGGAWPDLDNIKGVQPGEEPPKPKNTIDRVWDKAAGLNEALKDGIANTTRSASQGINDARALEDYEYYVLRDVFAGTTDSDGQFQLSETDRQNMLRGFRSIDRHATNEIRQLSKKYYRQADDLFDRSALSGAVALPAAASGALVLSEFGPIGAGLGAIVSGSPVAYRTWKIAAPTQRMISTMTDTYLALESRRGIDDELGTVPDYVTRRIVPLAAAITSEAITVIGGKIKTPGVTVDTVRENALKHLQNPKTISNLFARNYNGDGDMIELVRQATYDAITHGSTVTGNLGVTEEEFSTTFDMLFSQLKK